MMRRFRMAMAATTAALACARLLAQDAAATTGTQATPAAAPASSLARTAWGDPDLQGVWVRGVRPPFERPRELGTKTAWTDEELDAKIRAAEAARARRNQDILSGKEVQTLGERGFPLSVESEPNYAPIRIARRTSAIVDPPDGRLPAWTRQQIARWDALEQARAASGRGEGDSWLDRSPQERCIKVAGAAAAPYLTNPSDGIVAMNFAGYNPVRRIIQGRGTVALVMEEDAEYRIVPLDGRPAPAPGIRQWLGTARGHWDGDTLVVVTTNINDKQYGDPHLLPARREGGVYSGTGATLRITERFRRTGADALEYRVTVEDPETYVQPYTAVYELTRNDSYAEVPGMCQEANEGFMYGILVGARADEALARRGAEEVQKTRREQYERRKVEWNATGSK